nr:putative reverse transcriptase domain-containing protein [Tanacetum cinerariifolium]
MSQSRQHVLTSLIHIEPCKSPTKSLFDVGSSRISIFIVNTFVSLRCSGKFSRKRRFYRILRCFEQRVGRRVDAKREVFTNHKSLRHILVQKELNMRQRRWLKLLSNFDCDIHYHLGKANVIADALSMKERKPPLRVRAL